MTLFSRSVAAALGSSLALALAACASASNDEASVGSARAAMTAGDPRCTDPTLRYGGGPVSHDVYFHALYWIPGGDQNAFTIPSSIPIMQLSLDELPLGAVLAEYTDAAGKAPSMFGVSSDALTIPFPRAGSATDPLDRADLERALDARLKNEIYDPYEYVPLVILPVGIQACAHSPITRTGGVIDNAADCSMGTSGIDGWHGTTPGGHPYAVALGSSRLAQPGIAPNDPVTDAYMTTLVREMFNILTDPNPPSGWRTDASACGGGAPTDVGDLCKDIPTYYMLPLNNGDPPVKLSLTSVWSNEAHACLSSGPTCTGYWTCNGTQTDAVFQCSPLPDHAHYQLLRKTASGLAAVTTTVPSAGVLGANPNDPVYVHELGYVPSATETSLTYEVCVVSELTGVSSCGRAITLDGASNHCACEPKTCAALDACNVAVSDGCGGTVQCGACGDGSACNAGSCCPPGTSSDGAGHCACAPPPGGCGYGRAFDPDSCACVSNRPDPCVKTHSCY